ncbi:MAG: class I SAM-dependent methyltransferase [Acidobacteria bacterium]|nr:class I SAM-dependent methyltransferase [Acidobacteriota bacterium]
MHKRHKRSIQMQNNDRFLNEQFPRSSAYHPEWILAGASGGANPLWLTEWLAESMQLQPGMRVLDLGCGRALSSIFLHREFGVQVWAADLWFNVSENHQRIRDAHAGDGVFPIHADARALPFATEFFDAIVSIDSFMYYGTDDQYLSNIARFLKPGGKLGMAGSGLVREFEGPLPDHLREWWTPDLWCFHSPDWWRNHWDRTGLVNVSSADTMNDGWQLWRDWHKTIAPDNVAEIQTLEADRGDYLGYVRVVGTRTNVPIEEPIVSIPAQYTLRAMLRNSA